MDLWLKDSPNHANLREEREAREEGINHENKFNQLARSKPRGNSLKRENALNLIDSLKFKRVK